MGVDKFKDVGGVVVHMLRFICILFPINAFMRKLHGDSFLLPQAALLANLFLGDGEFLLQDGEDLQSCFNLFSLPEQWLGFMAFEKKVSKAFFSGPQANFAMLLLEPYQWVGRRQWISYRISQGDSHLKRVGSRRSWRFEGINPSLQLTPQWFAWMAGHFY